MRNVNGYVVRLSENATMSIVLNALEAYSVTHAKKERFVETYGSLFGYQNIMQDNRTLYQIESVNIDTSAEGEEGSVSFSLDAMKLKVETMSRHWPHLEYLGDFHTHPYEKCSEVRSTKSENGDKKGDNKGYFFSQGDKNSLEKLSDYYKESNCNYRLGLVVTIAAIAADRGKEATRIHPNCIEFNLKRNKMWITAYCAYNNVNKLQYTDNKDEMVFLECQSILGNIAPFL